MEYQETPISGVFVIQPRVFQDSRGYFIESFKQEEFEAHVGAVRFIQDNESASTRGVLRGLHYQRGDYSQAKLVRVISGEVFDVAVDLRRDSPTFGQHVGLVLSGDNKTQLFIPRGFAHGFLVMSERAVFTYKVDNPYNPASETCIRWSDPDLAISWPVTADMELILSPKDERGLPFREAELF